jgi:hypothetical protein
MCEAKVNIPFLKQEISVQNTLPLNDIKIVYDDPTLLETLTFYTFKISGIKLDGKISLGVSGEICDYKDHLEGKGILKFEDFVAGPYETEGGIVSFKRLFLHFKNLEIPIRLYYEYDDDTLCGEGGLTGANRKKEEQNGSTGGSPGGSTGGSTGETNVMGGPTGSNSGPTTGSNSGPTGGGTTGGTGITGGTGPVKRMPFEIILDGSQNKYQFDDFFVSNGLNETNINSIFNNLETLFPDSKFNPIFQSYIKVLDKTNLSGLVEKEMNRIYCLYKNKKPNKKEEITPQNAFYREKIERLKIQGNWNVIFKHN